MITCEQYTPATGTVERFTFDGACPLPTENRLLWIDAQAPTEDELAALAKSFQFHPLAMEDVRNGRQRAKVDRYPNADFIVLKSIQFFRHDLSVEVDELDIFLGANYLVTIHRTPLPVLTQTRSRWEEGKLHQPTAAFLFYLLSDAVVDSYFPIVDRIGEIIDDLDQQLFAGGEANPLRQIFALRRSLLEIRKTISPMRDAFNELMRDEDEGVMIASSQTRAYFTDVFDHILRLTDFVDTYRDMLSASLDAYQSAQANRLNTNMQRLTVAATILATATVITGFYGMNVAGLGINSLDNPHGALIILIVLVVVTLIEIWLFKKRGWL